uniref:Sensory neuron membrane protein 2 n=1 Tax=Phyllotreta striolata TaxID=444603 RepID=A0A1B1FKI5_PHYSR|nr:sensory neuron membrane protein 2 [Phyllotreta striolata]
MVNKNGLKLSNKVLIFVSVLGALMVIGGAYLGFKVVPDIIVNKIWETKILKENTEQWEAFMKTPFPYSFKVFVFDVQNPDDVLQGAKPRVKEVGPFVYKVAKWKDDVQWTSPDEISYHSYTKFEFDEASSGEYTENTEVTILNSPLYGILLKVEATKPEVFGLVEQAVPVAFAGHSQLFIKVKVGDLLFKGIKFCENAGENGGFATSIFCRNVMQKANESQSLRLENDAILFSNLHYKNNTHLGRFTVKSGGKERKESAALTLYNGKPFLSTWPGENSSCNRIRGFTTVFPANIKTDMVFESFSEDICRHVALEYDSKDAVKEIAGYKFVAKNDTFSSKTNKENSCFCSNRTKTFTTAEGCPEDGIIDLTPCKGGPVMVSFPHLLYADEGYARSVEGLRPVKSRHEPFVILEPLSGLPLYGSQRIQFNMFLRPIEGMENPWNVSRSLLPLIWVEESFVIPDQFIGKLNDNLFSKLNMINIVKWIVIVSGGAGLLLAGLTLVYRQAP